MKDDIKPGYFRVTEVLWFVSGLTEVDPLILKKAAERGDKVHQHCDALIQGFGQSQLDDEVKGYVHSALNWIESHKFLEKPKRIYCDKYEICGEVDGLYYDGNGITLFDFKTSSRVSKTWPLQLSAYAYLLRSVGIEVNNIEIIHLNKKGGDPTVIKYEENFDLFLNCLEIYKYLKVK
jgi:hypothetical protein